MWRFGTIRRWTGPLDTGRERDDFVVLVLDVGRALPRARSGRRGRRDSRPPTAQVSDHAHSWARGRRVPLPERASPALRGGHRGGLPHPPKLVRGAPCRGLAEDPDDVGVGCPSPRLPTRMRRASAPSSGGLQGRRVRRASKTSTTAITARGYGSPPRPACPHTPPVEPLVVVADDRAHQRQGTHRGGEAVAASGSSLSSATRPPSADRLEQHDVRHPDLAEVVEGSRRAGGRPPRPGPGPPLAQLHRVAGGADQPPAV